MLALARPDGQWGRVRGSPRAQCAREVTMLNEAEIKQSLARERLLGKGRGSRGFTERTRQAVVQYVGQRQREGARLDALARELGLAPMTMRRWLEEAGLYRPAPTFVPVVVKEDDGASFVVRGPGGLVVEGLSLAQVAELMRRLA